MAAAVDNIEDFSSTDDEHEVDMRVHAATNNDDNSRFSSVKHDVDIELLHV